MQHDELIALDDDDLMTLACSIAEPQCADWPKNQPSPKGFWKWNHRGQRWQRAFRWLDLNFSQQLAECLRFTLFVDVYRANGDSLSALASKGVRQGYGEDHSAARNAVVALLDLYDQLHGIPKPAQAQVP